MAANAGGAGFPLEQILLERLDSHDTRVRLALVFANITW